MASSAGAGASRSATAFLSCVGAFEAELDYVYRTIRRMGVRRAEAEDLTQEVFVVLWRRWGDFDQGTVRWPGCPRPSARC